MNKKPNRSAKATALHRRATHELRELSVKQEHGPMMAELYRRAKGQLRKHRKNQKSKTDVPKSETSPERLLHELQVHQIELELQNAELQKARDELEAALMDYTDLYDFAPVGYFSIDEVGVILKVNLTGATLLGVERSRLIEQRLLQFVVPASRPVFLNFMEQVFTGTADDSREVQLLKMNGATLWASLRATSAVSLKGTRKWCRVAFGDITARKEADEAQRRAKTLADTNVGLNREIARRTKVEKALRKSEQEQNRLLEESRRMQEQLRHLSHEILHAQEEERKRISRELHDEIAQILVGINVHLAVLSLNNAGPPAVFRQKMARTQQLVEKAVDTVHQFARELRPTALDDLGLIPALKSFMNEFMKRTGVFARLTAFPEVEQLNVELRTVLYRIAHEALNNVARHAQATRVEVSLEPLAGCVRMKIKDDGKSFDVERTLHANRGRRLGLLGMRERLEMVGGHFEVQSAPGKGTIIIAQIPLGKTGGAGKSARAVRASNYKP